jgi:hypothetical protein
VTDSEFDNEEALTLQDVLNAISDSEQRILKAINDVNSHSVTVKNYIIQDVEPCVTQAEQNAASLIQKAVRLYNSTKREVTLKYTLNKSYDGQDINNEFKCSFGRRDLLKDISSKFKAFLNQDAVNFTLAFNGKRVDTYRRMEEYAAYNKGSLIFMVVWKSILSGGGYLILLAFCGWCCCFFIVCF